jgi:hypothetical protein
MSYRRTILTVTALAFPLWAAQAQARPRAAAGPRGPLPSATELLNRRRALDLTPRQVARLDSIERAQWTERRAMAEQLQKQRDSICAGRRPCVLSQDEREKARTLFEQNRPRREAMWSRDSIANARALSVLDSTQRGRVQGWRMARREARFFRGQRGAAPRALRGQPGFYPRRRPDAPREFAPRFPRRMPGPGAEPGAPLGPRRFDRRGFMDDGFDGPRGMRRLPRRDDGGPNGPEDERPAPMARPDTLQH